ncbi:unnamed protein product (macronuclear) [Paramecium tetraurelia]|uniref:TOG domain-containing protein n=1 Tax=Paramecium tetraurelia TaxID=5888 RepID=A0BKJ2_PARTE|nr:uncharacterized protein GSPATT00029690001 [Paramecium tetraurelia]CAK59059.1 unnamed protein product [Paramecium tetraurelia]|eukprot:XP_001426457.1 hypothetical protein (macronuclear) [Paramecium tetraurelia strain d4-2]
MGDNPMDIFKDDMENEELYLKVNAMHRVRVIATLLGTDKIKSVLLPYFETLMKKEDDEVLFAMAEELGYIAQIIPQQSICLLPILEQLAGFDETVVREQAVKSIIIVCGFLGDNEISNTIVPLILKLASNEANFTCRVSAVSLMCPMYARAGNQKEKLRQKFTELCSEETPMVRRAVATKIGEIAQYMDKNHVIEVLITVLKQLCQDEQDQVRLLCMESIMNIANILNINENKTNILPLIISSAEDKSWRVRLALSKIFAELAEAVGKEIADSSLIQIFSNLLKDPESDVRVVAVKSLAKFIKFVSPEKLNLIIPLLQLLAKDAFAQVKQMACLVIGQIATILPRDNSQSKLQSYLIELMSDDNQDVRKNAAQSVGVFAAALGSDSLGQFIPHLKKCMEDPKWRVRKEIIQTVIQLALTIKNSEVFIKQLEPVYVMFLKDRAAEVRTIGLSRLNDLIQTYKIDWALGSFLSKCLETLNKDTGFLYRMNALYAIQQIGLVADGPTITDKLWPIVQKCMKDVVPNIRFVSIKVAKTLSKKIDHQGTLNQIKQAINEMTDDNDRDVKFYAQEALQY